MKKISVLILLFCLMSACQKEPAEVVVIETPPELAAVFQPVADEVTGAIPQVRTSVKPGDEVVFVAKIMGSETPFVDGRALAIVGDEDSLESCDVMDGDDHCKTPWDVCCADRQDILDGTATVQIVDSEGKVLSYGLKGINGLKELSRVKVKGVVAPISTGQALVINAVAIEVLE